MEIVNRSLDNWAKCQNNADKKRLVKKNATRARFPSPNNLFKAFNMTVKNDFCNRFVMSLHKLQ